MPENPISPSTWTIEGKLESDAQGTVFDQCRVEVFFEVVTTPPPTPNGDGAPSELRGNNAETASDDGRAPISVSSRASVLSDDRGEFTIELPNRDDLGPSLHFVVSAPSGETLADRELTVSRLQTPVHLKIRTVKAVILTPAADEDPEPAAISGTTRRVIGWVVERNGKPLPKVLQVLVYASTKGAATPEGAGVPVLVGRPDASGYFSGDVPNRDYDDARAYVAGLGAPITIKLEDHRFPAEAGSRDRRPGRDGGSDAGRKRGLRLQREGRHTAHTEPSGHRQRAGRVLI
jgi:hypothetical protein